MKLLITVICLVLAIVATHVRIDIVESSVRRLQTCSHGVAVMSADGKSSVNVCQP